MKVSTTNCFPKHLSFGTTYKKIHKADGTLKHENSTHFFVDDIQWNRLFDELIDKYNDTVKVNVFSLAGSDGSEALSIAMLLITKLGEKADKFFPVVSVDYDYEVMQLVRSGYIYLSKDDELRINKYTKNSLNKFLERTNKTYLTDKIGCSDRQELLTCFRIKPILKDKVIFVNENVDNFLTTMPNKNNVIFCRNCWVYFFKNEDQIAQKLSEKTDKNSYLITGDYDLLCCPMKHKNCYGFSMHKELDNVFDKSGSNYFDDMRFIFGGKYKDDI